MENVAAGIAETTANERIAHIQFILCARDGNVKQPAFLFLAIVAFRRARGGKQAVAEHDDEHDAELQALGLMDGREFDALGVVMRVILGLDIREQGELREKFLHAAELKGELRELLDLV